MGIVYMGPPVRPKAVYRHPLADLPQAQNAQPTPSLK